MARESIKAPLRSMSPRSCPSRSTPTYSNKRMARGSLAFAVIAKRRKPSRLWARLNGASTGAAPTIAVEFSHERMRARLPRDALFNECAT